MKQLCRLDELPEDGTYSFNSNGIGYFLVRNHRGIHCYLNSCPHRGIPLDWVPNQLLDPEKTFIQCASHGALFEIDSGRCVYGPCQGDYLKSLPCRVSDGWIEV